MDIQNLIINGVEKLNKNGIEDANLKAKNILAFILNVKKEYLIINSKEEVKKEDEDKFFDYIDLINEGKPLQYITHKQEFMGIDFYVDENVLIPQPDTEILVQEVIDICKLKEQIKILDLCTGSGAIAVSLAKNLNCKIVASDISEKALEIAKLNSNKNEVNNIKFIKSDMFENIKEKFDIIVSNPPYIETDVIRTLSKEVQNEPKLALDGGKDGLDFYKIIANNAYKFLNENGILILEIGYNQKKSVIKLLEDANKYKNINCKKDFSNNDRIVISKKV